MSLFASALDAPRPCRPAARAIPAPNAARQHYWDFARGALMLLGIPYHVAMCLREGQPWIVASPRGGLAYTWLADFIHLFRMPAFFLVAGYFAALMLGRRTPGEWMRGRLTRLGIPFLTALILVVPVLNIACELSGGDWAYAKGMFAQNMATSGGYWIRHLWFLIVLGYYTIAAAGLVALAPRLATARLPKTLDTHLATYFAPLLLAAAALVGLYELATNLPFIGISQLASRRVQEILRLDEALTYLPFFAIGAIVQRGPALLRAIALPSPLLTALAIVATIAAIVASHQPDGASTAAILGGAAALLLSQQLIVIAKAWFDRPSPLVDRLVAASFTTYLLHLPVLAVLLVVLLPLGWPLALLFAVVCTATLAICYAAFLVIQRVPLLNLLFNGVTPQPGGSSPAFLRR